MDSSNFERTSQENDDNNDEDDNDASIETEAFLVPSSPVSSTSAALSVYVNIHR